MAVLSIWRRRWLLTSFMLLLAVLVMVIAAVKLPRTYEARSLLVLLPSQQVSKQVGAGNPYLSFNNALSTAAAAVSSAVGDDQVASSLKARGFDEEYTIISESSLSQSSSSGTVLPGPFIAVAVTGANRIGVENTLTAVADEVSTMLSSMQRGISPNRRITAMSVSVDRTPSLSVTSRARSLVAVAIPILILALGIPAAVDGLLRRPQNKRIGKDASINSRERASQVQGNSSNYEENSFDRRPRLMTGQVDATAIPQRPVNQAPYQRTMHRDFK